MKKFLVTLEDNGKKNHLCFVIAATQREAIDIFMEEQFDCQNKITKITA